MSNLLRTRYSKRLAEEKGEDTAKEGSEVDEGKKDFDISSFLTELQAVESNVVRSAKDREAMEALDVTKAHYKRCCEAERLFIETLAGICKLYLTVCK